MRLLTQWGRKALWSATLCVIPVAVSAQQRESTAANKEKKAAANSDHTAKPASASAPSPAGTSSSSSSASATPSSAALAPPQVTRGSGSDDRTEPEYTRIPSTVGGLGFFTQESGETMPKGSFSFASYADKFSRMPGHTTVLNLGWNLAIGFHDRFSVLLQWDPYRYL
ncbi:MAG: hypothetical protein ACRD6I_16705, partial [Candidatus Acidiferrales bacterium]